VPTFQSRGQNWRKALLTGGAFLIE